MLFRFIPGMKPLGYGVDLFIRKKESDKYPFCVFYLEIANFSFQIAVPCIKKDKNMLKKNLITLVPIPGEDENVALAEQAFDYNPIMPKLVNLNNKRVIKDEPFDIALHFDDMETFNGEGGFIEDFLTQEGIELKKRL